MTENEQSQLTDQEGLENWAVGRDSSGVDIEASGADLPWRWQEGDLTVTRTCAWSAPGCHEGCGVKLYTDADGKFVKIEGDEENPYNQGRLCVRCLSFDQAINNPERLKYPMKRDPKDRGKDAWERISWDEAFDMIYEKFNGFKKDYGAESVLFVSGTGRDIATAMYRMSYAFGSPNICMFLSGIACYAPRMSATSVTIGNFVVPDCSMYFADRYDNPNWKVPGVIFVWGNNPLVSNADGNFGHWIIDCVRRGSKLVVVDPRLMWLSAKADLFLQIRPGTDAALALAMINIIIEEDLYDHEFVENWTYGVDELAELASDYPADKVAEITTIPAEKIYRAAHMSMECKPLAIQWGVALDQTRMAIPSSMALIGLMGLSGCIDVPGGMITTHQPFGAAVWMPPPVEEFLDPQVIERRIGKQEFPFYNYSGCVSAQPDRAYDALLTGEPYPVKGIWLQATNPLACTSQTPQKKALAALNCAEFIVHVDMYMTPTTMAVADVVLPVKTFAERNGCRSVWYYVQPINETVALADGMDVKSDVEINYELGKRWNPDVWPWDRVEGYFDHLVEACGIDFEQLREMNWIYPHFEYYKYKKGKQRMDNQLGFNTPSGRFELYSTLLASWGFDPLPQYEEPDMSPVSTPELMDEYPLILTTGPRTWPYFHSEGRQVPRLRALRPDPIMEIHPDSAARYGVEDGDWVLIENPYGKAKMKAEVSIAVPDGTISIDHAWWFPEAGPENLYDVFESNANELIPPDYGYGGFGANLKSLICKITRIDRESEGEGSHAA